MTIFFFITKIKKNKIYVSIIRDNQLIKFIFMNIIADKFLSLENYLNSYVKLNTVKQMVIRGLQTDNFSGVLCRQ